MNKLLSMELKRAAKSPILWLGGASQSLCKPPN